MDDIAMDILCNISMRSSGSRGPCGVHCRFVLTPSRAAREACGVAWRRRSGADCILKSEPEAGRIMIDSETVLSGALAEAWSYRLGNRSAIDWVLDQHKEKTPKDPTIREKFDTYWFKDHKERVIELLASVARVSLETVRVVQGLERLPR